MDSYKWWRSIQQIGLDLLFPPTDRNRYVRQLNQEAINELPRADTVEAEYLRAVFDYQHKTTRTIVQAAKYDGDREAARIMGKQLYDEILPLCEDRCVISEKVGLVPIPLSEKRYQKRGFNQCRRIIKSILSTAGQDNHFEERNVLEKTKDTTPQTNLNKNKRQRNLKGCFRMKEENDVRNENVIIIDDVTTTGATIAEAKQVLERSNPESVSALTFAH